MCHVIFVTSKQNYLWSAKSTSCNTATSGLGPALTTPTSILLDHM